MVLPISMLEEVLYDTFSSGHSLDKMAFWTLSWYLQLEESSAVIPRPMIIVMEVLSLHMEGQKTLTWIPIISPSSCSCGLGSKLEYIQSKRLTGADWGATLQFQNYILFRKYDFFAGPSKGRTFPCYTLHCKKMIPKPCTWSSLYHQMLNHRVWGYQSFRPINSALSNR